MIGGKLMRLTTKSIIVFLLALLMIVSLSGMKGVDVDDWEKWSNDDSEARALAVNEGDLEFLGSPPEKPPHILHNKLTINTKSLSDGWVGLIQCHENLDKVREAQILYHARRTRKLEVVSSVGIDRAWVEKNSVQMLNINNNARICVKAEVHSLYPNYDGTYSMYNGPFHRRFLDGYYPMRVTMDVDLPKGKLKFGAITPMEQAGFKVDYDQDSMQIDALFVGELNIEVHFDGFES